MATIVPAIIFYHLGNKQSGRESDTFNKGIATKVDSAAQINKQLFKEIHNIEDTLKKIKLPLVNLKTKKRN